MNMNSDKRKYYIDNLRWLILLVLVPYHTAMAWNAWDEPNYIYFEPDRLLSGIVVFFSPFFMPLLFTLAGIGTKYALKKRTYKEYVAERAKRLLVPFLFGTLVLMPPMTYIADKFNLGYDGGFLRHYAVFFTEFTDLTGADGGFSVGQFWFMLYLFVISSVCAAVLVPLITKEQKSRKVLPFWAVLALGLPLPLLSEVLSVGGKSLAEYTYFFLLGYFVFSDDEIISKAKKLCLPLLAAGLAASALDVYLFLWSDKSYPLLNNAAKYISEWVMIIALLGFAKKYLDRTGKAAEFMKARSFMFYTFHFIWVVLFQYLLFPVCGSTTALFLVTVLLSYIMTFVCCEICIRVPFLCFLTGTKYNRK